MKKEAIKLTSLKKKYTRIPKFKQQRNEMYKEIANIIESEKDSFTISDIMECLVDNFNGEVDNERRTYLKEIEECISEADDAPLVKKEKGVSFFTIIRG